MTTLQSGMLSGWTDAHTAQFQSEIMTFEHNLAQTGLFEDEALIALLDRHPSHMLDVCTMDQNSNPDMPNKFLTGDFRGVPSKDLVEAAKAGKIWINMRMAMRIHDEYRDVLDQMYGDLRAATGKRALNPKGGILISSPVAQVPYHFDKTETILWHVRGEKTVYVWPVDQKFISDVSHETVLTDMMADDLPYTPDFEKDATIITLKPGQGATWPLNAPHRVDNRSFCVSVTTEYSTHESVTKNSVMRTNAALRKYLHMNPLYEREGAISRRVKSVAGQVIKRTPLSSDTTPPDIVTFKIDPNVPGYLVNTDPYERTF